MKPNGKIAQVLLFLFWLGGSGAAVQAQSQNVQALNWFKVAIQENDSDKKVAAYLKALEFEPTFVEALYNLGLTYKKQQNYQLAEQYLARALSARPGQTPDEVRLRVTYELASVFRRNGKNPQAEEAYRQARSLTGDATLRGNITLELGRLLFEQGKLQEALAELRNSPKAGEENALQIDTLIKQVQVESELQRLYDAASSAQSGGNLQQAQMVFTQIQQTRPGYKDVEARLASLSLALESEKRQDTLAAVYEQAQQQAREGNWEAATVSYESIAQQDANYKDTATRLETARKQLAQKQRDQLVAEKYDEGMTAYKQRDWTHAIIAFEKAVGVDAEYKDARKRLAEAQKELDRESVETVTTRYYADGVAALNRNDLGGALAAFEKVQRLNPRYRNLQALLAQVEQALSRNPTTTVATAGTTPARLDSLYQQAMAAAGRQDWLAAVVAFEKLQILQPNFREVVEQLAVARTRLQAGASGQAAENMHVESGRANWSWAGRVALLALVPLLGAVFRSPTVRARYQVFRGNYAGAVQIYEQYLARKPARTKLYPALANLYLLLGRNDEQALRVFKTVLQLNLPMPNRPEINGIVAQHFLQEGRMDSDAIEVLENALKSEREKQLHDGRTSS